MADLQEQLNAILENPEAMEQISRLARSLTGDRPAPQEAQIPTPAQESGGGAPPPDLSGLLTSLDPGLVRAALDLYGEYTAPRDARTALLDALEPFLREERRQKLEKAKKAVRLARVIRSAMALLGKEGDGRV